MSKETKVEMVAVVHTAAAYINNRLVKAGEQFLIPKGSKLEKGMRLVAAEKPEKEDKPKKDDGKKEPQKPTEPEAGKTLGDIQSSGQAPV